MTALIARDEVQKPAARFSYLGNHRSGEPLLEVVYADPGNNGFYYREKKPDSVTCYIRIDTFARSLLAAHDEIDRLRAERDAFEGNAKDAYTKWIAEKDRADLLAAQAPATHMGE